MGDLRTEFRSHTTRTKNAFALEERGEAYKN
jgi:hypothetical protein